MFLVTVPLPIIFSITAVLSPSFRPFASLAGLVISLLDIIIVDEVQKRCRKLAARIQEIFDCELLKIDWNFFKTGERVAWEKIHSYSEKYKQKWRPLQKEDWYSPSVGQVELPAARIICQRTNIFWDSDVRRTYVAGLGVVAVLVLLVAIIIGLSLSMSLADFILSLLAPLFPTVLWLLKEGKKQWESTETLGRLISRVGELWQSLISKKYSEDQLNIHSRELQDEIFEHRCSNQAVFNWIYLLLRTRQETQMNIGAEELVRQITS